MSDNESTIADENGDFSDWIEIYNPDPTPVSLENWYLTDNATNLTKWRFPAVTLAPGEFKIVWASSKNRRVPTGPLHTNFALSKDGEFLALVRPNGTTLEQSYSPAFPAQKGNESHGLMFDTATLLAGDAEGRYHVPANAAALPADWNQPGFTGDSTWSSGPGGFGFGITVPGITVRQVSKNGNINGLADALNLLALPPTSPTVLMSTTDIRETINILGEGADGHYAFNSAPPGGAADHYVIEATGFVTIPTAGTYTFGMNSDDGGRILIDGNPLITDDNGHAPQDNLASITLTAGTHSFQVVMFEMAGGDEVEFFAAPGTHTSFDAGLFRLVGDVANGGLETKTGSAGSGGVVGTDMTAALGSNTSAFFRVPFTTTGPGTATSLSLVMRYNDGFTAWLNGSPVASANVPGSVAWDSAATASRTTEATLRKQGFNLTSSLSGLANGQNLLAIQGMNFSNTDGSFLVLPELVMGQLSTTNTNTVAYGEGLATPGWINGPPSSLGDVADTQFSVKRGIFDAPVSLTITSTTPGAVIHYTTDGSTPDETHGTLYTGPITISSTTVVRARATLAGWEPTDVDTQTYLFPNDIVVQSPTGTAPPGWPATSGTGQVLDFGMDPDVVNSSNTDIGSPATVKAALKAIPSVSITTDLPNLLNINGSQGIYSNPNQRGFAWERPVSMEWINPPSDAHPNGTSEFQINGGIRLRGGYSRSMDNPKHAFRLFFRDEYGESKLRYPLFGKDAAQEFDKIDLRTAQNYSWSFGNSDQNTFLRDESTRQAQIDMGWAGSHVRYFHLYLNGVYWGLYDLDERTEAAFSESYLGGDKEDYDVVKPEQEQNFEISATDGNVATWQELWTKAKVHRASPTNANYFKLMGLAADGVTQTPDPVLLDPDNLIDYLLITFWSGNFDGCVSAFLGNEKANNWFGSRRRDGNPRQGFQFFVHDFEHSLFGTNEDRTGPFNSANESNFLFYNPLFLHQDLTANAEYRMRWADRIQKHLFNNGALTSTAWQNRINKLAADVDKSIVAESARWGDAGSTLRTKQTWITAQNQLLNYLTPRSTVVLNQLKADNLYPNLAAPALNPADGNQPLGTQVAIEGPSGATLHYMADGSDPRAIGGALKSGALTYVASTSTQVLVPMTTGGWKYQHTGPDLGTAWREDGYNDSAWPAGSTEFGYGDNDEATLLPVVDILPGTSGVQRPATYYFRKTFSVSDLSQLSSAKVTVKYDDAYAVYLNGTRIGGNLPLNPAYDYYSGTIIEDITASTTFAPSLLRLGNNTLAVEIHQANNTSTDLSMNCSLEITRSNSPTPIFLNDIGPKHLMVRAKNGSVWSAVTETTYQVGTSLPTATDLVVSEISYFPAEPNGDAEFLELLNVGTNPLDLSGAHFTEGIEFTFPAGTTLAAGARILVVKDLTAFQALYGTGKPVAGIFANETGLSNTGERLQLLSAGGDTLLDFTYGTTFPWPVSANGQGSTLVLVNPQAPDDPLSWRPSVSQEGTPGTSDSIARAPGEGLLAYAIGSTTPSFNRGTQLFSVTRQLGADGATLLPEWSNDLIEWNTGSLELISDTNQGTGTSILTWKLDPLPPDEAFIRLKVSEKPGN